MTIEHPQTWHYGLIARYWAEFNDDFRPHEIPYFRAFVERDGNRRSTLPAGRAGCSSRISGPASTSTGVTSPPT
jgi:hypothetical protein